MTFPRHVCDDDDIQFLALGLCVCGGGAAATAGKHYMKNTEQLVEMVIKEEMIIFETFIIIKMIKRVRRTIKLVFSCLTNR